MKNATRKPTPRNRSKIDLGVAPVPNQLTTSDLAKIVQSAVKAEGVTLTSKTIAMVLQKYERAVLENIVTGKSIRLDTIGVLDTEVQNHRIVADPATGGRVDNPEHRVIKFKQSAALEAAVKYTGIKNENDTKS